MTPDERWLTAIWPFVHAALPATPARIVELGCGVLGGFVPRLEAAGYQAIGVDPEAPPGPCYRQAEFQNADLPAGLDAVVACVSLHHVADLAGVLDLMHAVLVPGGVAVVVEWAREAFDDATASWCFDRLPEPDREHPDWLRQRQTEWLESGQPWDSYLRSWAEAAGMHTGQEIVAELEDRFDSRPIAYGPYFFPDLADISEADEQAAIDNGLIQANRICYVGQRKPRRALPA